MKGYLQNEGERPRFILQRQINPGGKVLFEDAYKSVGKRSGLDEGPAFVEWLRDTVLTRGEWGYYKREGTIFKFKEKAVSKSGEGTAKTSSKKSEDARGAGRVMRRDTSETRTARAEITPADLINVEYAEAKKLIDKTRDKSVLRKALAMTHHFSKKEAHQRHLMQRISQV